MLLLPCIAFSLSHAQTDARIGEIQSVWKELSPHYFDEPFSERPNLKSPFRAGKLKAEFIQDGFNLIRFVRFLAKVPNDLVLDEGLTEKAQHGSVLLSTLTQIAHQAPQPSGMAEDFYSLASQGLRQGNVSRQTGARANLPQLIFDQIYDNRENSPHVGHRRWLLNPRLKKIGLGFSEVIETLRGDGVVMAQDQTRPPEEFGKVLWPAEGPFPLEFCPEETPWSVTLDPSVYRTPEVGQVQVQMTTPERTLTFNPVKSADFDKPAEFAVINTQGYGVANAVIFRPPLKQRYEDGQTYRIKITGLQLASGTSTEINYSVTFFSLNKKQS